MPEITTPSSDSGDITNATQDNWEQRYKGLQAVLAKRDTELTTHSAELDRLKAEHEQAISDLATYRQREVDTSEEDLARQQYEDLRARFEPETPTPIGNNQARPARGWEDGSETTYAARERVGSVGFPT